MNIFFPDSFMTIVQKTYYCKLREDQSLFLCNLRPHNQDMLIVQSAPLLLTTRAIIICD